MNNFGRLSLGIGIRKKITCSCCKNKGFHLSSEQNSNNVNHQVKVFQKLLGTKKSGSKKRWFINNNLEQTKLIGNPSNISRTKNEGKNANRRVQVLNKLFMKNITDLMANGEVSDEILGKGIEVSRVKVTPDFQNINVYWICKGTVNDNEIEKILCRCSGIIRHELSQLRLMGEVPKIHFVKDRSYAKLIEIDTILKTCSFSDQDYIKYDIGVQTRNELNLEYCEYNNRDEINNYIDDDNDDDDVKEEILPIMRHDVLGLNHKEIMDKILMKMKKSKLAWDKYENNEINVQIPIKRSNKEMEKLQQKLEEIKSKESEFEKFLMRRKYKKNTPDRKKFNKYEESIVWCDNKSDFDDDKSNRKDDDDYIEDIENTNRP